jgi:hypothetical protein
MQIDKRSAQHDSRIAPLEQAMSALAEAQVKTDRDLAKLARAMTALAEAQAKTEATTRALSRQWQAYLNTWRKN